MEDANPVMVVATPLRGGATGSELQTLRPPVFAHAADTVVVVAKARSYRKVGLGFVGILVLGAIAGTMAGLFIIDKDPVKADAAPAPPPAPGTVSSSAASSTLAGMTLQQQKEVFAKDSKELGNLVKFEDKVAVEDRGSTTPKSAKVMAATLDKSIDDIQSSPVARFRFEYTFKQAITKGVPGVEADQVVIVNIVAGSVRVIFYFKEPQKPPLPPPSPGPSPSNAGGSTGGGAGAGAISPDGPDPGTGSTTGSDLGFNMESPSGEGSGQGPDPIFAGGMYGEGGDAGESSGSGSGAGASQPSDDNTKSCKVSVKSRLLSARART